jgi:hypothetical protein
MTSAQAQTRAATAACAPMIHASVAQVSAARPEPAVTRALVAIRALAATYARRAGPVRAGAPVWTHG